MGTHQGLRRVLTRYLYSTAGVGFDDHKTTKHWDGAAKTKHQLMLKATESLRRHRLAAFSIRKTKTAVESLMKSMQSAGSTETMDVQRGTILTKWRLALLKGVIDKRLLMVSPLFCRSAVHRALSLKHLDMDYCCWCCVIIWFQFRAFAE
eukprot:scaffold384011_cov20-Prasinocladus_malaysianus.AAC.1